LGTETKTKEVLPLKNELGTFEIRMESIGGQGANLAGKILAEAGIVEMGLNGVNFASYGSEKKGTPVKSFVRFQPGGRAAPAGDFLDHPREIRPDHAGGEAGHQYHSQHQARRRGSPRPSQDTRPGDAVHGRRGKDSRRGKGSGEHHHHGHGRARDRLPDPRGRRDASSRTSRPSTGATRKSRSSRSPTTASTTTFLSSPSGRNSGGRTLPWAAPS